MLSIFEDILDSKGYFSRVKGIRRLKRRGLRPSLFRTFSQGGEEGKVGENKETSRGIMGEAVSGKEEWA